MNTNVDKEVAALLANDEDALRAWGRSVYNSLDLNYEKDQEEDTAATKDPEQAKADLIKLIEQLMEQVEVEFGRLLVNLSNRAFFSLERLVAGENIFEELDSTIHFGIMSSAESLEIIDKVQEAIANSNVTVSELELYYTLCSCALNEIEDAETLHKKYLHERDISMWEQRTDDDYDALMWEQRTDDDN